MGIVNVPWSSSVSTRALFWFGMTACCVAPARAQEPAVEDGVLVGDEPIDGTAEAVAIDPRLEEIAPIATARRRCRALTAFNPRRRSTRSSELHYERSRTANDDRCREDRHGSTWRQSCVSPAVRARTASKSFVQGGEVVNRFQLFAWIAGYRLGLAGMSVFDVARVARTERGR
jgi:hypothetical protein